MSDPAAPFEASFPAIAADHGLASEELSAALDRLTAAVATYPGVHDLVYEYRRNFRLDPLVARHGPAYYLRVPPRVWAEFADRVELSESELAACRAVHAAVLQATTEPDDHPADHEPLVLVA